MWTSREGSGRPLRPEASLAIGRSKPPPHPECPASAVGPHPAHRGGHAARWGPGPASWWPWPCRAWAPSSRWCCGSGGRTGLTILLPAIGLFLTTAWLGLTRIGEVSLFKDMDLARKRPLQGLPVLGLHRQGGGLRPDHRLRRAAPASRGPASGSGRPWGSRYHRLLRAASAPGPFRSLARPPWSWSGAAPPRPWRGVPGPHLRGAHGRRAPWPARAGGPHPLPGVGGLGLRVLPTIMGHAPLLPLPKAYPVPARHRGRSSGPCCWAPPAAWPPRLPAG